MQLKETMMESEGSGREQGYQQYVEMMEGALKQKEKEMSRIRAAEKARVSVSMWNKRL